MRKGFLFLLAVSCQINAFGQITADKLNASDYKNFLTGKFNPDTCKYFEHLSAEHCDKAGSVLQKETYTAFKKMYQAAKAEGIRLKIISATRNYSKQKQIWEAKWIRKDFAKVPPTYERAEKIMKYSSMPGTSRHHWGTDMDLNVLNNEALSKGEGKKLYDWLVKNASKYGFCQVYSEKGKKRPDGYEEEKWHWSYLPLAQKYLNDYAKHIKAENISGFNGAKSFQEMEVLKKYVLGINSECR